ncbi:polysaccharide lyase family 8 super-sandwich domain-containing protein [Echinicola pacifica]|nr:polysaccharide lyase family 8 super-sandwich domain-containing protein [Echinicola pacifica]
MLFQTISLSSWSTNCKILIFGLLCLLSSGTLDAQDLSPVLQKHRELLLKNRVKSGNMDNYIKNFNLQEGAWSDLNYQDKDKTGWDVTTHLYRCRYLSYAYANPSSGYHNSPKILAILNSALDHFLSIGYKNRNWFPMEVSIPSVLLDVEILLGDELSASNKQRMNEFCSHVKIYKSGANLIYLGNNVLHYALLTGNEALAEEAVTKMLGEITRGSATAIQDDYSFYHHKERLQQFSYGGAFLQISSQLAWELSDSKYAFPADKVDILRQFMLQGMRWMVRGKYTVPPTIDRAASRKESLSSTISIETVEFLEDLDPANKAAYQQMKEQLSSPKAMSVIGTRAFYKGEILTHHTREFSTFVKVISDRTQPVESINGENTQGKFSSFGNNFFLKNGKEYYDLMAFWNWNLQPGFTYSPSANAIIRKPFSGVLATEELGLASMDYALEDASHKPVLKAKKTWFTHGDIMVALVSDLQSSTKEVKTAMDQSRWAGWVQTNGKNLSSAQGYTMDQGEFVFHNGLVYGTGPSSLISLDLIDKKASWGDINIKYKGEKPLMDKVFLPYIKQSEGDFYYYIAPARNLGEAKAIHSSAGFEVNMNNEKAQIIQFSEDIIAGVIWDSSYKVMLGKHSVTFSHPSYFIYNNGDLTFTNPSSEVLEMELTIDDKRIKVVLDKLNGNTRRIPE